MAGDLLCGDEGAIGGVCCLKKLGLGASLAGL